VLAFDDNVVRLKTELRKIASLGSVLELLEWDHQVFLPKGGQNLRATQTSAMTEVVHRARTNAELGRLIESLLAVEDSLKPDDRIVVRDAYRNYQRQTKIPEAFAAKKAERQSVAYQVWLDAREAKNFGLFADCLEEQIALCKEEAAYVGTHESAYHFWLDTFDPGLDVGLVERLFTPLGKALAEMIPPLLEAQQSRTTFSQRTFAIPSQRIFLNEVIQKLGFDFEHGRVDESVHPFCSGTGQDIRMTTRFFEHNPLDSLYSAIHESGHAMYEQGLPQSEFGNALGSCVGMAVHESQSRLWENQVARSEAFWHYWEPRYRQLFPDQMADITHEQWLNKILEVKCIPIRVDSDEVTYHLHIIIRFELEKALFDGSLAVKDLPEAWNAAYDKYLGFRPADDKVGVLQDVHWATGAFGYFPSYTVGTMISAQLWDSILKKSPDVVKKIKKGEYLPILTWLRDHIHAKGRSYPTHELVKVATGNPLSEQPLIEYLREKYYGFYGIRP